MTNYEEKIKYYDNAILKYLYLLKWDGTTKNAIKILSFGPEAETLISIYKIRNKQLKFNESIKKYYK